MKGARELLAWMNKGLDFNIGHFVGFGQTLRFFLKHIKSSVDHILLELTMNHFDFTGGLVITLQNRRLLILLHRSLNRSSRILLPLISHFPLSNSRPIACNLIHMMIDFPVHFFVVFLVDFLVLFNGEGDPVFWENDHHYSSWLSGLDLNL